MGWCGVTLERAAPGDIYPSYATARRWGIWHILSIEEHFSTWKMTYFH